MSKTTKHYHLVDSQKVMPKTLIVAGTSYAGMGPYVASIVNSFRPEDNVRFFLVESQDKYFSANIKDGLKPLSRIIMANRPSKIDTLLNLLYNEGFAFRSELLSYCQEEGVEVVHILNSLFDPHLVGMLSQRAKLVYTVHDLHPHEQNKAWYKEWRMNVLHRRVAGEINVSPVLYTNSESQTKELSELYPSRTCYNAPFPTLVTERIAKAGKTIKRLEGIGRYILFFGRIEEYKGLDILSTAFLEAKLPEDIKLVIAGKGEYKGKRDNRIVLLNQYIEDEEIADLYGNASVVVYPYISATQSGVLSIASYFGTPMILSDVSFFKEEAGPDYPLMFKAGNVRALTNLLQEFFKTDSFHKYHLISRGIYEKRYSQSQIRDLHIRIYSNL